MDEVIKFRVFIIFNTSTDFTVKSYDMGPSRFTSHSKEGVLRIFIALKNQLLRPGLNLQPLGSLASTLTTTPPSEYCGT
jgi:hypothetical protein